RPGARPPGPETSGPESSGPESSGPESSGPNQDPGPKTPGPKTLAQRPWPRDPGLETLGPASNRRHLSSRRPTRRRPSLKTPSTQGPRPRGQALEVSTLLTKACLGWCLMLPDASGSLDLGLLGGGTPSLGALAQHLGDALHGTAFVELFDRRDFPRHAVERRLIELTLRVGLLRLALGAVEIAYDLSDGDEIP